MWTHAAPLHPWSRKPKAAAVAVAVVVVVTVAVALTSWQHRQASDGTIQRIAQPGDGHPSVTHDAGVVAAVVPDAHCDLRATPPQLPVGTDPQRVEDQESNPPSQADTGAEPMGESQAIESARSSSDGAQTATAEGRRGLDLTRLPAAAVLAPYQEASRWAGGAPDTSIVASSRCVWAVTVHAPFVPRSYPPGRRPPAFDSYTVLFDELSGQSLGLSAGTDAGDLITGDRVSTP